MAGSASFFQTWPREGRRLRHLRRQARPSPVPRRAAPEGGSAPLRDPNPLLSAAAREAPPAAGAHGARPGPAAGLAARLVGKQAGRGLRPAAHPGRLQTWLPALHNPRARPRRRPHARALPSGKRTGRASGSKFAFPPAVLPVAAGARGRQRVNARALAPPSAPSARLPRPCPRPSCEQRLPRAAAGARWPAGGHHYLQVIGGRGRPRVGVPLTAAGVRFLSSRWILLFMSMFPSSPLSKLNFPRRGRRGERRPGLRGEGRRREAAGGGGVVPGGVRACGRAEPPEPSYSRERRETMEGKGGWSAALASLPPPPAKAPHCA